jgi:hypothetical protein
MARARLANKGRSASLPPPHPRVSVSVCVRPAKHVRPHAPRWLALGRATSRTSALQFSATRPRTHCRTSGVGTTVIAHRPASSGFHLPAAGIAYGGSGMSGAVGVPTKCRCVAVRGPGSMPGLLQGRRVLSKPLHRCGQGRRHGCTSVDVQQLGPARSGCGYAQPPCAGHARSGGDRQRRARWRGPSRPPRRPGTARVTPSSLPPVRRFSLRRAHIR